MLLVILTIIPLIGALILYFTKDKSINIPLIISAVVIILACLGLGSVFKGVPITYKIPLSGPFVPTFHADALSVIFVMLASFLWFVVSMYAPEYMKHEGRAKSFELCTLLTLSAVLGVFLAGDLFTILLFFELMTITSYFWVIHKWNEEAIRAGYFYLFFSIIGGLLIALGIVLMGEATDVLPAIGAGFVTPLNSPMFAWSIALFVAGFGIKAGMVPLHLWLPHAHSVSPTPGSALLSGLLIKVGAYGLIRVGELAGWGMKLSSGIKFGPGLAVLGICTMLVGVAAALLQSDAKRLLAYHSVSQMGYIILGIGITLYFNGESVLGLTGAIYHTVNHALFKSALFLGIGIIILRTGEQNLYKMGGLWRKFPLTALLVLIAVLGITGTPGLNGYASKTVLHHAVSEAAHTNSSLMIWIERLFLVVGVGTTASFAKLFYLAFLGKPNSKLKINKGNNRLLMTPMIVLSLVMLIIGFMPQLFIDKLAVPALKSLGFSTNLFGQIKGINFWTAADLRGMFITLTLGIAFCGLGLKTGLFHWKPPAWLSIEALAKTVLVGFNQAVSFCGHAVQITGRWFKQSLYRFYSSLMMLSTSLDYNTDNNKTTSVSFSNLNFSTGIIITILFLVFIFYLF